MAIKYVDRIHGYFIGTTAELLAKTEELTENQGAINTETGDIVYGPGKYAEIATTGKVDLRARVLLTSNVTIATALVAGEVHDGVTLVDGDVVFANGQTTAVEKGLYVVGDTPARTSHVFADYAGKLIHIAEGTSHAGKLLRCTNVDGGTLGTNALTTLYVPGRELMLSDNLLGSQLNNNTVAYGTDKILVLDETAGRGTIKAITLDNVKTFMSL